MKNIAIIGASYLQLPLIRKAKAMGLKTHVFAWKCDDVGEKEADCFYPISIVEKDEILKKCQEIGIDAISTIATDLGIITVNYVAGKLGLCANSMDCTERSTNKHLMRRCFELNNDPSPKSLCVETATDLKNENLTYPLIVKPLDRSGSRGITKVYSFEELDEAIESAKKEGFEKKALVEEFAEGNEYSVECISFKGKHQFLRMTKKYTTGAPNYIEKGHMEKAPVDDEMLRKVIETVYHALNSLGIEYGASHSELKIDEKGNIKLIEIGGRMGGDFIGSNLVELSSGYDFVKNVINVSLGIEPEEFDKDKNMYSGVRFIMNKEDAEVLEILRASDPDILVDYDINYEDINKPITDSSNRHGYFIICSDKAELIEKYMPKLDM